jgi:hypothetical protein
MSTRRDDGSEIQFHQARQAWPDAADAILMGVATRYHATTYHKDLELADEVQKAAAIHTDVRRRDG